MSLEREQQLRLEALNTVVMGVVLCTLIISIAIWFVSIVLARQATAALRYEHCAEMYAYSAAAGTSVLTQKMCGEGYTNDSKP